MTCYMHVSLSVITKRITNPLTSYTSWYDDCKSNFVLACFHILLLLSNCLPTIQPPGFYLKIAKTQNIFLALQKNALDSFFLAYHLILFGIFSVKYRVKIPYQPSLPTPLSLSVILTKLASLLSGSANTLERHGREFHQVAYTTGLTYVSIRDHTLLLLS